jgi:RNA-directed DNA polymerase
MRSSHPFFESNFFQFQNIEDFIKVLGNDFPIEELQKVQLLANLDLPPITSRVTLAALLGINPGILWSFENKTKKHYRTFSIPKGNSNRIINAPKVGLKIIQKWLSVQLQNKIKFADHVYGFVVGRSHIDAAKKHTGAKWVFSVDIKDYFQTTPIDLVAHSLISIGYDESGAELLSKLFCLNGFLAQGAPSSPVVSNMCFKKTDEVLSQISLKYSVRMTRYADDIVFSGINEFNEELKSEVLSLFEHLPWTISEKKIEFWQLPNRLKVHGLLVHGENVRLTKGYRNKLRAFKHVLGNNDNVVNKEKLLGHINYGEHVKINA